MKIIPITNATVSDILRGHDKMAAFKPIPWMRPRIAPRAKEFVAQALSSSWISDGAYIKEFEKKFAQINGSPYGITTSSGTTALHLALLALDLKKGDEVILPGFGFAAAVNMAISVGATPVYADIDPLTWCVDPKSIEEKITPKTKALVAIHTYGNMCEMDQIIVLAKKHKLTTIEDAAEAVFSKYNGHPAGSIADLGTFSFQAAKTLSMGEGGFVITKNLKLYRVMRQIRNHGMDENKRYWHSRIGHNFRLTNLQAALGMAQLEGWREIVRVRRRLYGIYQKYLSGEKGITLQSFHPHIEAVPWTFAVALQPEFFKGKRDWVIRRLGEVGIESRPGFYPMSAMPRYRAKGLKISERVGQTVLCLPFFTQLTDGEIKFICAQLLKLRK